MNTRCFVLTILILLTISAAHAESYTFRDSTSFTTVDYVSGSNNPAPVTTRTQTVSGTKGIISDVNVSLNNVYSNGTLDMTYVLVAPNNTGVTLMSHAGTFHAGQTKLGAVEHYLKNVNLNFDDSAPYGIYTPTNPWQAWHAYIPSGSYKLSVKLSVQDWLYYSTPNTYFPSGEPNGGYYSPENVAVRNPVEEGIFAGVNFAETNELSAFNDISANGEWKLLAYDNIGCKYPDGSRPPTLTQVTGGWTLNITTTSGAVPEPEEWVLIGLCVCGIVVLTFRPQVAGLKIF